MANEPHVKELAVMIGPNRCMLMFVIQIEITHREYLVSLMEKRAKGVYLTPDEFHWSNALHAVVSTFTKSYHEFNGAYHAIQKIEDTILELEERVNDHYSGQIKMLEALGYAKK